MAGRSILYVIVGLLSTMLAILGVMLPGLPTTIFVLIALWAFAKSSERLYQWFERIPLLRPAIREARRFERERTIDIRIKLVAQAFSWGSFVICTLLIQNLFVSITTLTLAMSCSVIMFIIPTKKQLVVELIEEE